ncbi:MAG: coproporphyrinogen III oxidase [Geminicoccaceae bacterium]|nr:coproporphyrinogen III oxidase [Geminicoccaceae bacterium]
MRDVIIDRTGDRDNRPDRHATAGATDQDLGLYVHWPFCTTKCPYCDFNSHVAARIDHARWRSALVAELEHAALETGGRRLASIFFGGGTPSLMHAETVAAVIDRARALFAVDDETEITLEANPTSVEAGRFAAFAEAGVNRVSLGIQSLDDRALRFLGRRHDAAEAVRALDVAMSHFARVSIDLIYARAGQTEADWLAELDRALAFEVGHLSLYQLTIEPGTRFHALHDAGRLPVLDDAMQCRLFVATHERLAKAGFDTYEVSNHARPGQACRHNLIYWRYGDFLGIGPGAHGRLLTSDGTRVATSRLRSPAEWLEAVRIEGHGALPFQALAPIETLHEALLMGLRLTEGVPLDRLRSLVGDVGPILDVRQVERARREGLLVIDEGRLRATFAGRMVLDGLIAAIAP